jgi:PEP-CTERM motif
MKTVIPSKPLDLRLAGYAAAAGACLLTAPGSNAAIIYSGPVNIPIPITITGLYLNVITGANSTITGGVPGWDVNPWGTMDLAWFGLTPTVNSGYIVNFPGGSSPDLVDNLPLGSVIGPAPFLWAESRHSETTGATAFNLNSEGNYVGFHFLNEITGLTNYGWLQVHLGESFTDPSRSIIGYAYENSGGAIFSGPLDPMPEPSTYALLGITALGALGVRAWRRHKAA